ncbi:aminotransferase class V-fold PLP-dependent enzyme, partial [Alkalihalophilus pseudofirmus]
MIIVGPYEHHSNYLPWKYLAKKASATFVVLPINVDGVVDYEFIKRNSSRIKIISISSVSNVFGFKIDVKKVCELADDK